MILSEKIWKELTVTGFIIDKKLGVRAVWKFYWVNHWVEEAHFYETFAQQKFQSQVRILSSRLLDISIRIIPCKYDWFTGIFVFIPVSLLQKISNLRWVIRWVKTGTAFVLTRMLLIHWISKDCIIFLTLLREFEMDSNLRTHRKVKSEIKSFQIVSKVCHQLWALYKTPFKGARSM